MLVEVKAKVARIIDSKTRKRTETFLVDDCQIFVDAESAVMDYLINQVNSGEVGEWDIQSLRISSIKEVANQFTGNDTFIVTLRDIWLDDDGNEKSLKYNILIWADNPSQAMANTLTLARQGYDMQVEGIKQVDYEYLTDRRDSND